MLRRINRLLSRQDSIRKTSMLLDPMERFMIHLIGLTMLRKPEQGVISGQNELPLYLLWEDLAQCRKV